MTSEHVTNVAAGAAITNYFWLPSLEQAHALAAFLLTVLGVLWFAVQIYCKLTGRCRGK